MSKDKKMSKEYAIVISLILFFTIVILVGIIRISLVTRDRLNRVDLTNIDFVEANTSIDLASYNLRIANAIQEEYGLEVYYGLSPELESVSAVAVIDDNVIFTMLKELNSVLSKYPKDLIREIESKGYELSVHLVDYFTRNVEAVANRNSIGQMKIFISNTVDIQRALHHEYYHILDYYVRLETDENIAYLNWDQYNPSDFEYLEDITKITTEYVYDDEPGAYFVTPYAKYSEKEDRAETFAEMITADRSEVFFNDYEPIKGKMDIIRNVLFDTFMTVKLEDNVAWE